VKNVAHKQQRIKLIQGVTFSLRCPPDVAGGASGHQPGKRNLEVAETQPLKRGKTLDTPERASQGKPNAIVCKGSKAKKQKSKQCAKKCRPGFKSDGKPLLGSLGKEQWGFRWRAHYRIEKEQIFITTPYRSTRKETSDDYIQVYQAQEGVANERTRRAVMQRVAAFLKKCRAKKQVSDRTLTSEEVATRASQGKPNAIVCKGSKAKEQQKSSKRAPKNKRSATVTQ